MTTPADPTTFWNAHYGQKPQVWSGRPNGVLVDEVGDLAPGTALDLGCGEGADAVWLAAGGWSVTAVDVSDTALDRAQRAARSEGVDGEITWERHDLAESFPAGTYDLVSAQFLQSPIEFPVERILMSAATAVAPGGTLLIVSHAAPPSWATGHDHPPGRFPNPTATATALGLDRPSWDLLVCERRERAATSPTGGPGVHVDGVVRARRR